MDCQSSARLEEGPCSDVHLRVCEGLPVRICHRDLPRVFLQHIAWDMQLTKGDLDINSKGHGILMPFVQRKNSHSMHSQPMSKIHRCTFSYPNGCLFSWVVSTTYQDAMALFWTVSHVMTSNEGTDGKQHHDCPLINTIFYSMYLASSGCPFGAP